MRTKTSRRSISRSLDDATCVPGIQEPERAGCQRDEPPKRRCIAKFSQEEQREIVFKDVTTGAVTDTTVMDTAGIADYRSVLGYFAQTIMKDLRLVSGYDVLYGKVRAFVRDELFDRQVELEDANTLRNLSETYGDKDGAGEF